MTKWALLLVALLAASPAATAADASMMGGYFSPDRLTVKEGETVTWTNDDSIAHTVTSSWDNGATFNKVVRPGETFSWTFEEAGSYAIHCRPHAHASEGGGMEGMVMTVEVEAAGAAPAPDAAAPATDGAGEKPARDNVRMLLLGGLAFIGLAALGGWQWLRRPTRS